MNLRARHFAGALSLLIGATSLSAAPALAHHSFSMFDFTKIVEVTGTVKKLDWTNPHSWLQIEATDETGQVKQWSFEMGGSGAMARKGWKPKLVLPGDKVTVTMAPLKNGTPGGALLSIVLPDGRKVSG